MKSHKKTTLSCEQVFEIWQQEPELITILDIRDEKSFLKLHIPGSTHLSIDELQNFMERIGKKLAVIVANDNQKAFVEKKLNEADNFIIVRDFDRWAKLNSNSSTLKAEMVNNIPEVNCENVFENSNKVRLIDVRRPDEFNGELGHAPNAELITLGADLSHFLIEANKEQPLVFICRSGARSGKATEESLKLGFKKVYNMTGGMLRWNEVNLPIEKN